MLSLRNKVLVFLALFSISAEASQYDLETNVRALGMGGAFTALVANGDALFYNPAGLSRVDGVYWTIADPRVGISNVDTLATLGDLQTDSGLAGTLSDLYGEPVFFAGGAKSSLVAPYFGAMYYYNVNGSLSLSNPVYPEFDVNYANDQGIAVGFAFPLIPKVMYTGIAVKRIQRQGGNTTISGDILGNLDSADLTSAIENTGTGYSLDIGVNFTAPSVGITPTFAFVWKNVGQTSFVTSSTSTLAPDEEDMIAAGAIEVDAAVFTFTGSLEMRKLNDPDTQLAKKIYLGAEFTMPFFDFRAGFHQGYYTLGAGLDMGLMQIDLATYGVELGDFPGQKEDRRYIMSILFEIGVGGFGVFSDGDGADGVGAKRRQRKLKQRR
tara:strand:- start:65441 stop:66583 length:1143 start_codon:yes stop_codon:yes gene_type:complete